MFFAYLTLLLAMFYLFVTFIEKNLDTGGEWRQAHRWIIIIVDKIG